MAITRQICEGTGGAVTLDQNSSTTLTCHGGKNDGKEVIYLRIGPARQIPPEWKRMITSLSEVISSENRMKQAMAALTGAPDEFLKKHKIPGAPKGKAITGVHMFKRFGSDAASGTSLRYVGRMSWNDDHYICDYYERDDGTQFDVCWCQ